MTDNRELSPPPRSQAPHRSHRSDDEVAAAAARMIRALAKRLATADPDGAPLLAELDLELAAAWRKAVAGWRATGYSDAQIADQLGVTRQAVRQRWPHSPPE